ncbi:hypothetical protein, partial [Nocardia sp. NPDC003354]
MRCDPVRPDPAPGGHRTGTRRTAVRTHRMLALAAVAAVAILSAGCVRPAADSLAPAPADPGVSATADQQSATEPGDRSGSDGGSAGTAPGGSPDSGAAPGNRPDSGAAPGGPIGEAGGGGSAPGGPVGPGARPSA